MRQKTLNGALAVAYIRQSTGKQELSPEAQRLAIQSWAQARGITVHSWHADTCSGGAPLDKRPGLLAAVAAVAAVGAGILVTARRDRYTRDPRQTAPVDLDLERRGVVVQSADGTVAPVDPASRLVAGVLDAFGAYERALIRARTKAALGAKAARGERVGTVPYGRQLGADGRTLEDNAQELATLARARGLRAQGLTLRQVQAALTSAGMVNRKGHPFALPALHKMTA